MYLNRKGNKATGETFMSFNTLGDYVRTIVNIYSGAELDRKYWLTTREIDFFIALSHHVLIGITNPISEDAVQIYKKHFNPQINKKDISTYLSRICKKKWAVYDVETKVVRINPIIAELDVGEDRMDFKIRLVLEQNEID